MADTVIIEPHTDEATVISDSPAAEVAESKITTLYKAAEAAAQKHNEAIQEGTYADVAKATSDVDEAITEYNAEVRAMCFRECAATPDPMKAAATMRWYVGIKKKVDKVGDDVKVPVMSLIYVNKPIALDALHKHVKGGIGHDKGWINMAQKFNMLLTVRNIVNIEKGKSDPAKVARELHSSYAMSQIARELDMGETPMSETAILKKLKVVVSAMIGDDYKVTTKDLWYLLEAHTKKDRKSMTITAATHKQMYDILGDICHKLVTGTTYEVAFKKAKDKK